MGFLACCMMRLHLLLCVRLDRGRGLCFTRASIRTGRRSGEHALETDTHSPKLSEAHRHATADTPLLQLCAKPLRRGNVTARTSIPKITTLAIPFLVIASVTSGIIIENKVLGNASPNGCNSLGRFCNPNSSTVLPRAWRSHNRFDRGL